MTAIMSFNSSLLVLIHTSDSPLLNETSQEVFGVNRFQAGIKGTDANFSVPPNIVTAYKIASKALMDKDHFRTTKKNLRNKKRTLI
jgi:hypothetical protein